MNSTAKTVLFWVLVVASAGVLYTVVQNGKNQRPDKEISFSEFMTEANQGKVAEVTVTGQEVRGKYADKSAFHSTAPDKDQTMVKQLLDKGVNVNVKDLAAGSWSTWLPTLAPFVLLAAFWFFMIRQMQMGGNKALSFGKSREIGRAHV